jgi:hypothetical protein
MDHRVDTPERRHQVVARDVGTDPAGALELEPRLPAGDADDLLDAVVTAERGEQARPDVAGRAGDGDPHQIPADGGVRR